LERHQLHCNEIVKRKYPGKVFQNSKTVFEDLDDLDISTTHELRFYSYRSTYDYECFFSHNDIPTPSEKLTRKAVHIPCSVSICSNLKGFESPVCFVNEGSALDLVKKKIEYLERISKAAYEILRPK